MKEVEAHELQRVIQQEAPVFETTVLPVRWDERDTSGFDTYEVAIRTDALSLEVYSFDDWRRLLRQIQQIGGTKELTPTALEAWMQSEREKAATTVNTPPDWVMTDERLEEETMSEDELWSVVYEDDPTVHKKQSSPGSLLFPSSTG